MKKEINAPKLFLVYVILLGIIIVAGIIIDTAIRFGV